VKAARDCWFEKFAEVAAKDLVFLDEFGASTQMARTHGRAPPGERVVVKVPHGHWKLISTIAALTTAGIVASASFDGATDTELFLAFLREGLVPALRKGQVVVMDNLSAHTSAKVEGLIESAGARLLLLPPYSPDFNPIEMAISKIKALLRSESQREVGPLFKAIARSLAEVTAGNAKAYIGHCGYAATSRCKRL
jgi:transposase